MAEFDFKCPNCGRVLRGDDQYTGRNTTCPACKSTIVIPIKPAPQPPVPQPMLVQNANKGVDTDGFATYMSPGAHPSEEKPIFETRPSWKAFIGWLILALVVLILGLVVGGVIYKSTPNSIFSPIFNWLGVLGAVAIILFVVIKRFSLKYRLTTQRFFIIRGIIRRDISELELFRVKDVELMQGFTDRVFNIGKLIIFSTDETAPKEEVLGIDDPVKMKDTLRLHFREARNRERVRPTEFISDFQDGGLDQHDQL